MSISIPRHLPHVLLSLLLVACAGSKEPATLTPAGSRDGGLLVLSRADHNRSADLRVGETFELRLAENPTTGFGWAIDSSDNQRLALESTTYSAPEQSGFVGARGQRTFTFRARQPGDVVLALKYWRFWEGDASVSERFSVNLHILP